MWAGHYACGLCEDGKWARLKILNGIYEPRGVNEEDLKSIEKKVVVDEDQAICSSSADRTAWQPRDLARRIWAWKCV